MSAIDFRTTFGALTGHPPFPWQERLYGRLASGDPPSACDLPTGLGKTSVIPIWLIALANHPRCVPRRLVYVVNRRTVVDQATDEAAKVRKRLPDDLSNELAKLCAEPGDIPLGISTLRGEFADNTEWRSDPSRPAVIVGTVDVIGSRLLFSGYGLGFKARPLHAGFLGQDSLLVHDEAHLEPAFQKLIEAIRDEHKHEPALLGAGRRFRIMALSATRRGDETPPEGDTFEIDDEDRAHPVISERIHALKSLALHQLDDPKKLADRLADLALKHKESRCAVLVFARSVEDVEKVAARLEKESGKSRVKSLTGTLRGKERDELVGTDVLKRFLPSPLPEDETVYLVCTSAGEVGVNISADHLVCDLTTFESMAQRFGRVNRFGRREDTRVDVVNPAKFAEGDQESRREKTLELLRRLGGDASPDALGRLLGHIDAETLRDAFSQKPLIPPTSDILFDSWAMTTVRGDLPGRPPVEPYLHGLSEDELPRTKVAWRDDVRFITRPLLDRYNATAAGLLAEYPLKPHEVLEDSSYRVFKHMATLAKRHPDEPIWLIGVKGEIEMLDLKTLADKDRKDRINGRTVLLPPTVGGLSDGLLNGEAEEADDVADDWKDEAGEHRRERRPEHRAREAPPEGMRLIRTIDLDPEADERESEGDEGPDSDEEVKPAQYWSWYTKPESADDDGSRSSKWVVAWGVHTDDVARRAEQIVGALGLPDELRRPLIVAARLHDEGKKRIPWQKSIGNPKPTVWLAKPGKTKSGGLIKPVEIGLTYRHEFGSLLDAEEAQGFLALSDDQKKMVLHLIAAHHGRGRPHFEPDEAFDPGRPRGRADAMAAEVPRRFARLQRKYGRWGLAYLESILRAADWAASAQPSEVVESL